MQLNEILEEIRPADRAAAEACSARLSNIAKPLGSLGKLETLLIRIAGICGSPEIDLSRKCVLVFCADNGVTVHGVTQCGSDVTASIARSLSRGKASVCAMSAACGADVFPVDMGIAAHVPGLTDRRMGSGTGDIFTGPAMSRETAERAIAAGAELVREKKEEGYRLIATGEAGIGNTTTAAAVSAVLLQKPAEQVTGRGSGLTDEGLQRKREVIRQAISVNRPDEHDPADVIAKVGGFDIAAMTGAFLGGASCGIPVVMDGVISAAAALAAVRMDERVKDFILTSHISAEPAGILLCEALGFSPIIHGDLRLGEGTGAVALFPLLDLASAVYNHAATFSDIAVEAYKKL